jgi:hypothetical protein
MTIRASYRFVLHPFALVDVIQMLRHGEIDRALAYAEAQMQIIGPLECIDDGETDSGDRDLPDELINSPGMNTPKP